MNIPIFWHLRFYVWIFQFSEIWAFSSEFSYFLTFELSVVNFLIFSHSNFLLWVVQFLTFGFSSVNFPIFLQLAVNFLILWHSHFQFVKFTIFLHLVSSWEFYNFCDSSFEWRKFSNFLIFNFFTLFGHSSCNFVNGILTRSILRLVNYCCYTVLFIIFFI